MEYILNLITVLITLLLGGSLIYYIKNQNDGTDNIKEPISNEELKYLKELKEDELRKKDSKTYINDTLDNADNVNNIKSTSDKEFDRIYKKHIDK